MRLMTSRIESSKEGMNGLRSCVRVLVLLLVSNVLFAKGIMTRIVIEGSGLTSPIAITDPTVLKDFNVWAGRGTYMNGTEGTQGFSSTGLRNTSSIHRNGMSGHWFRATREWQDAVRSLLAQAF